MWNRSLMTPPQNGSFNSHIGLEGGVFRPSQVNSSQTTDAGALFNLHCARREAGRWHSGSIWSCWPPLCFHRLNNWRAHWWLPLLLPLPHVQVLDLPPHARFAGRRHGSDLKTNIWHGGFKSNPMTPPLRGELKTFESSLTDRVAALHFLKEEVVVQNWRIL